LNLILKLKLAMLNE